MTRSRKYAALAAAVLLALLGLAVALRADDDGSSVAAPETTDRATTAGTTSATQPDEPAAKTGARTEAQGGTGPSTRTAPGTTTTGVTTRPTTDATTAAAPERPYALAPTRSCLRAAGATVSPVRSSDPRLRALGDLAQRTSLEVKLDGRTLGLAFGDARLLQSLLLVPDDPYRLEVRRNALLMYRPDARDAAGVIRGCLRS